MSPHLDGRGALGESASALGSLPLAAARLDADGAIRDPNLPMARFFGVSEEELDGRLLGEFLHPDAHGGLAQFLTSDHDTPRTLPARVVRHDGSVRWARLHATRFGGDTAVFIEDTQPVHSSAEVEQAVTARFELLARHVSDALVVVDSSGRVARVSKGLTAMLGHEPEDVIGADVFDYIHPDDRPGAVQTFLDFLGLDYQAPKVMSLRVQRADGEWCAVEASATNHVEDALVGGLVVTIHDVSAIREARSREQAADRRFRMLVDALPDPVVIIDRDVTVSYANVTACRLMCRDLEELRGRPINQAGLPRSIGQAWQRAFAEVVATGEERDLELGYPGSDSRSRRWFWTRLAPELDANGTVVKVIAVGRDITERKEVERRLQDLARRDPLTGLANRRHLDDVLANAIDRSRGGGASLAVLFCDLDGLKAVNDTHGHDIGDRLLLAFARRLRRSARADDTVFRLGGDEFVVVCEALSDPGEGVAAARRILGRVSRRYAIGGLELDVTASIGAVTVTADEAASITAAELLRDADAAMYHAKVHGGGTVASFDRRADAPVMPLSR